MGRILVLQFVQRIAGKSDGVLPEEDRSSIVVLYKTLYAIESSSYFDSLSCSSLRWLIFKVLLVAIRLPFFFLFTLFVLFHLLVFSFFPFSFFRSFAYFSTSFVFSCLVFPFVLRSEHLSHLSLLCCLFWIFSHRIVLFALPYFLSTVFISFASFALVPFVFAFFLFAQRISPFVVTFVLISHLLRFFSSYFSLLPYILFVNLISFVSYSCDLPSYFFSIAFLLLCRY